MGLKDDLLYVEGITKIFGKKNNPNSVVALDNITFTMEKGANSILGPNGAGKSTLLKILLGYLKADSGKAQLLGFDIFKEGKKIRELVGYMPEQHTIIPGVNAVKLVSLLGRISGLPKAESMQRAHDALQFVGLDEARYRKVNEFSTGMIQRLKFAQAIVNDPELIILDEPTNGLDPKGRTNMINLINEINQVHGKNIIVSSHLLPDIEATCKYATILNFGKLVAQGNIAELTGQEALSVNQRIMNVSIKGDLNDFLTALKNKGFKFEVVDKIIQIPFKENTIGHEIIKIAHSVGVQIRSLTPRKAILEDVFVHKIEGEQDVQSNTSTRSNGGK